MPPLRKSHTYMILALLMRSPSTPPTKVKASMVAPHSARYNPCSKASLPVVFRM